MISHPTQRRRLRYPTIRMLVLSFILAGPQAQESSRRVFTASSGGSIRNTSPKLRWNLKIIKNSPPLKLTSSSFLIFIFGFHVSFAGVLLCFFLCGDFSFCANVSLRVFCFFGGGFWLHSRYRWKFPHKNWVNLEIF